ncbi:MAG: hypothetical protein M1826_004367 [Phylliscum demangeonii]|nr:MAG: hypothetical protein M1826_004367 [Phylliscum demangeonii]
MAAPRHGALGLSWTVVRGLQAISLIAIIGMTANFVAQMVQAGSPPPAVLVGTLTVTSIAVLYCIITIILFIDQILPFLLSTALDGLLLIAVVVVAVTIGKPLSYMDCTTIGLETGNVSSAIAFANNMAYNWNKDGPQVDYARWAGATKPACYEAKSVWGLSLALCIMFAFSAVCSVCLWRRNRMGAGAGVVAKRLDV